MTRPEKELCNCLSCVLLGKNKQPEVSDFRALLYVAQHHSVTALLVDLPAECLQGVERPLRLQLIGFATTVETQHLVMNKCIAEMAEMLEKEDFGYFLLKGQNCAARYPNPIRRHVGDVDLYIRPQYFDRATAIFEGCGFHVTESTMLHLSMSNGNGIELELHHDLQRLQWPRHDAALRRMCNETKQSESITLAGKAISVLPQELDIVVLCVHTMSHLYCAGLGLRHVCDYMMRVRWSLNKDLDLERMESMLREVGAYRVYCVLNYICNTYLHAELPLPMDKRNGERVLRWMMKSGNFSHGVDMGKGMLRFIRYYGQFLWHCVAFFPVSPMESLAWPVMKLKRALRNEAHRKTSK